MQNDHRRHILLVCKARHEHAAALGQKAGQWLRQQGHSATVISAGENASAYADNTLDLVVVLGGDGTMLGVARRLVGRSVPMLGINFGRVGFLTDAQPEQWQEKLAAFLNGRANVRSCMALTWSLVRQGAIVSKGCAVNDVVLGRDALARLICLEISVDGRHMGSLRSDGIIISTPVGASGYCVSAGGPLLYPSMDAIAFTPVCPFLHSSPPMVFPGTTSFAVRILQGSTECCLTVDGQEGMQLARDDTVIVAGLPAAVRFMGEGSCFFERLRSCGFILPGTVDESEDMA